MLPNRLTRLAFTVTVDAMKNITVSVDDEIYHAAREEAARQRTSVSAYVRQALVDFANRRQPGETRRNQENAQRQHLVDLLEQCNLDLTERPTREAAYADRRFH